MDITSFVLGMKLGGGDKEASDFNLKLASTVLTRNASYLGDSTTLDIPSFKLPDGNLFGTVSPYVYAGFDTVQRIKIDMTVIIAEFAFAGDKQLELIDISSYTTLGTLNFQAHSLEGIAYLSETSNPEWRFPLKTIICRPDKGYSLKNVIFQAGSLPDVPEGFEKPYVYVPAADYDTVASNWMTDGDIPLSHLRKLEDYPEIDRWNEKFTVRYFDGDTLLKTKIFKYGASGSYTPTKEGYKFVGWDKDVSKVTEDMDVYATWIPASIADASWSEIAAAAEAGLLSKVYSIGAEKDITVTYADGSTETVTMVLEAFNTDILYGGSNSSVDKTKKTNATFLAKNALRQTRKMRNSGSGYYNSSSLNQWLNGEFYNGLPSDLQAVIKEKQLAFYGGSKCWVPTHKELGGTARSGYDEYYSTAYSRYTSNAKRIKKLGNDGEATPYHTSTFNTTGTYGSTYLYCDATGSIGSAAYASAQYGVVVGFCI